MSRVIDRDTPLSDEDRAYLEERGRHGLISQIDRRTGAAGAQNAVPPEGPAPAAEADGMSEDEWNEYVDGLSVDELKAELRERSLSTSGNKEELQQRLLQA